MGDGFEGQGHGNGTDVANGTGDNGTCSGVDGGADPWQPPELATVEFLVPIIVLILFNLVVLFGNLLVITAVFTHKKLRTVTNTFIVSLAVADLMLGFIVLPFSSANEVLRYWPFGDLWCSVWLAVDVWLCTASILNLCAISLDRYLAITHPFKYPRLMSHVRARVLVAAVWVVSFVICFPPLLGWNERGAGLGGDGADALMDTSEAHTGSGATGGGGGGGGMASAQPTEMISVTDFVSLGGAHLVASSSAAAARNATATGSGGVVVGDGGGYVIRTNGTLHYLTGGDANGTRYVECHSGVPVCALTSAPGYIIYSALGSFWIPVWIMVFFYWRIYRTAVKTTSALRRGVLTTKTGNCQSSPNSDNAVTLRVHRGGANASNTSFKTSRSPSEDHSQSSRLIAGGGGGGQSQAVGRRRSDMAADAANGGNDNGANCRKASSSANHRDTSAAAVTSSSASSSSRNGFLGRKKRPRIRITFSRSEPGGFEMTKGAGERQPLRPHRTSINHDPDTPPVASSCGSGGGGGGGGGPQQSYHHRQNHHLHHGYGRHVQLIQNGTRVARVESLIPDSDARPSMDESSTDSRSAGFLNKVGRMHLKSHLKRINKEKKAAKTVGIIVGGFIFCWAPFFTVYLLGAFYPDTTPQILFTIFFWLGYCNSAVNPCVYALCSRDFRYAFKKLIRCRVERARKVERTGTRFMSLLNSIRIQISSRASDSNSE